MIAQTAPPDLEHPRIVSKLLTLDYATKLCRQVSSCPVEHGDQEMSGRPPSLGVSSWKTLHSPSAAERYRREFSGRFWDRCG